MVYISQRLGSVLISSFFKKKWNKPIICLILHQKTNQPNGLAWIISVCQFINFSLHSYRLRVVPLYIYIHVFLFLIFTFVMNLSVNLICFLIPSMSKEDQLYFPLKRTYWFYNNLITQLLNISLRFHVFFFLSILANY